MKVYLNGVKEMRKLAKAYPPLSAEPLRKALDRSTGVIAAEAISQAPVKTGKLRRMVRRWVSKAPWPRRARVYDNATTKSGGKPFRYAMALNYGEVVARKSKHGRISAYQWHYAGSGRRVKGWFTKGADIWRTAIVGILATAVNEIAQEWDRR